MVVVWVKSIVSDSWAIGCWWESIPDMSAVSMDRYDKVGAANSAGSMDSLVTQQNFSEVGTARVDTAAVAEVDFYHIEYSRGWWGWAITDKLSSQMITMYNDIEHDKHTHTHTIKSGEKRLGNSTTIGKTVITLGN